MDNQRGRGYYVQRNYSYETLNTNETESDWRDRVIEEWTGVFDGGGVEYMAFVFHDRDVLVDGAPKPLHAHALMKFENARYLGGVMKLMGTSSEENTQLVRSYTDSARYMLHISETALNEMKFIYSLDDVTCLNCDLRTLMARDGEKKVQQKEFQDYVAVVGKQIRTGELTKKDVESLIVEKYDEAHWRKVRNDFDVDEREYLADMGKDAMINGKDRTLVYSSGPGEIGKTSTMRLVSKKFLDSRGVHKVSVGGRGLTFDFAGTYNGQKVTIADDLDSAYFHYRDFFGLFDPHEYAPSKSRNTDKHWLADYCFITNSSPLNKWIFSLIYYSTRDLQGDTKDKTLTKDALTLLWQAVRRFSYWLDFEADKITIRIPTRKRLLKDQYGNMVNMVEEIESRKQSFGMDVLDYYFMDYAVIKFDDLFKNQNEIADKIAEVLKGNKDVNGVDFL